MTQPTGIDVAREALRLVGTPFRDQGRDADGLDCQGLVVAAVLAAGGDLPPIAKAPARANRALIIETLEKHTRPIARQPGALAVFLKFEEWMHFGVLTERGVVHALSNPGRVVHHWPLGPIAHHIKQVRAIPGVEYG